jgi:outer membrane protein assembly factor BamD (BamD/ComL family)
LITRRLATVALSIILLAGTMLPQARAAYQNFEPTAVKDAQFGEVLFYFYQEDYFPAIVRLLAAQKQTQLENHLDESELLLGGMYLSYGHHLRAAEIFEKLLADNVGQDVRDRIWFFLAKIWHQRGYLAESQQALDRIEADMPEPFEAERHMLQAQLHIDNGQHEQAIALLSNWRGRDAWANYAKFNLGVALVRSGKVNDASRILNQLGKLDPLNEELASLRDKANLALGYAYLQDRQPIAAKAPLQRVRLDGPFSNKALLGVGWADAENDNYRRALVPWMELRGRDLLDPAVQESMLAIPYAMAKLSSISQAADHYLNAVEAFYEEARRIDQAIYRIESGEYLGEFLAQDPLNTSGWSWKLEALPEGMESRFLFHLLATHRFQEGLKNYRDLSYLWRNLDEWQQNIDVYRAMLDTREFAYNERLPRTEQSLAQADLDSLIARKLELDARLNSIEEKADSLALASKHEFDLWGEIIAIERNPALEVNIAEAQEVRDKIRLLKGTLQWDLDREFKSRVWQIRRDLQQTGEALVETSRSRRQVDESIRKEPLLFAGFDQRVEDLSPKIEDLKARLEGAMERQRAFMLGVAVDELRAQRQRLDTYTVQARFALAAIYDLAATAKVDAGFDSQ